MKLTSDGTSRLRREAGGQEPFPGLRRPQSRGLSGRAARMRRPADRFRRLARIQRPGPSPGTPLRFVIFAACRRTPTAPLVPPAQPREMASAGDGRFGSVFFRKRSGSARKRGWRRMKVRNDIPADGS